jgi:hypothetical protein
LGKLTTVFLIFALAAAAWWLGAWDKIKPHFSGGASSIQLPNVTGLHKCVAGEKVLYTDGVCPAGYTTGAVKGSMTVLALPAATPPSKPSSGPNATQQSGSANAGLIKQKMVERTVGE